MSIAREIVGFAMEAGSSDIHLEEDSPIAVRVNSDIKVSPQKLDSEDMDQLLLELLGEDKLKELVLNEVSIKSFIEDKEIKKAGLKFLNPNEAAAFLNRPTAPPQLKTSSGELFRK